MRLLAVNENWERASLVREHGYDALQVERVGDVARGLRSSANLLESVFSDTNLQRLCELPSGSPVALDSCVAPWHMNIVATKPRVNACRTGVSAHCRHPCLETLPSRALHRGSEVAADRVGSRFHSQSKVDHPSTSGLLLVTRRNRDRRIRCRERPSDTPPNTYHTRFGAVRFRRRVSAGHASACRALDGPRRPGRQKRSVSGLVYAGGGM